MAQGTDKVISRIKNIASNRISIPVINNIPAKAIKNILVTLSQGCPSSKNWINPFLIYMERRLHGILIHSLPTAGPKLRNGLKPGRVDEHYKVYGLTDNAKPTVSIMAEFFLVDEAIPLFECSSGCRLHRDPTGAPLARARCCPGLGR